MLRLTLSDATFSPWRVVFSSRVVHVKFVEETGTWGTVSSKHVGFPFWYFLCLHTFSHLSLLLWFLPLFSPSHVFQLALITNQKRKINLNMTAFWDIAPCNLIAVDRSFRDAYSYHNQVALLKRPSTSTILHVAISQKALIFILPVVRTRNFTEVNLFYKRRCESYYLI
jgi:hypothetical protein